MLAPKLTECGREANTQLLLAPVKVCNHLFHLPDIVPRPQRLRHRASKLPVPGQDGLVHFGVPSLGNDVDAHQNLQHVLELGPPIGHPPVSARHGNGQQLSAGNKMVVHDALDPLLQLVVDGLKHLLDVSVVLGRLLLLLDLLLRLGKLVIQIADVAVSNLFVGKEAVDVVLVLFLPYAPVVLDRKSVV